MHVHVYIYIYINFRVCSEPWTRVCAPGEIIAVTGGGGRVCGMGARHGGRWGVRGQVAERRRRQRRTPAPSAKEETYHELHGKPSKSRKTPKQRWIILV